MGLACGCCTNPQIESKASGQPNLGPPPNTHNRSAARLLVTRNLTLEAAYGRYRQPARAEDLSSVFGNPLLGSADATHYLVGGDAALGAVLGVEATLFYSSSGELPVRNPLPSPRVAETLLDLGEGRSFGAQLLVRKNLSDGWFGWLATPRSAANEGMLLARPGGCSISIRPTFSRRCSPTISAVASRASWAACAGETSCTGAEPFVLFDTETEALVDRTEIILASWYATAGEFDDHRPGATDATPGQAENTWRAPPGPADVGMWVVLRDGRGGVGYAAYRFAVE